ncbi:MFS general substrate transporter [Cylindrobasidium torrendii FP15055 ss-10]|uniref:MFS general substrate transporter n=1 Tax=Cylindrobasidium torrendii FP15055 ss-10 TaxID=1314674 RepID=A0A0D7BFZ9_9AGAR|nr:MFS general substrate transporter [Cylindrobasidium torrendii FP15055 ss-10]
MVADIIRDSALGQIINHLSGGKFLPYADQRPGYIAGTNPYSITAFNNKTSFFASQATLAGDETKFGAELTREDTLVVVDLEKAKDIAGPDVQASTYDDTNLIGWMGDDDQDNPQNWSTKKRAFVAFSICLMTFTMYIGSAIYTPAIPGVVEEFGVSVTYATLGLTLYAIGYGIGPMFLTPLQEVAEYGRNAVYIPTFILFILCQIPVFTTKDVKTIMAFRFLTGFFGSPALAVGGASMGDIFPGRQVPYVIGIWSISAFAGPMTGPVVGGFAAQAEGWRWTLYELLWISGFTLMFLSLFLPETYGPTILLKRAKRLRKLTGNTQLCTQTEKDTADQTLFKVFKEALALPLILAMEPALLFSSVYIGFVYGVLYLWFESFPLVFTDIYGFNLGVTNLPFTGSIVTAIITYTVYCFYLKCHIEPRTVRAEAAGTPLHAEVRLEIGLMASAFIPISVLIFGFSAREDVHWIVPTIGAALYLPGIYLNFMSILTYVVFAYPQYPHAVLTSNDLARSIIAGIFPLFGRAYFDGLGLAKGSAILAAISVLLWIVFFCLYKTGHSLRSRSKYATV